MNDVILMECLFNRQLKIDIANLSQIIDQGTGLSVGQEQEVQCNPCFPCFLASV